MRKSEFDPGQARVYPLPRRDPMKALADWGAPPNPPIRPDEPGAYERPWDSPGRPPWVEPDRRRTPFWAWVCVVDGVVLLMVVAYAVLS